MDFFHTLFIFLMNNALFVIHSIIHSIVQQKYSFKKFIHSKKHANYSFKEFIHSKKSKIIHSKNLFIQENPKLFIQRKYSFKWKIDYRPGLDPHLDVSVENTLGVKVVDPLQNFMTDHGYQGLLHHGLRHNVSEWPSLHVLHHHEQVHLHHVSLQLIDKVGSFRL